MKNALPPFCFPLLGTVVLGLSLSSPARPQEPKPADPSATAFTPADKSERKNQPNVSDSGTQATSSNSGANPAKPEDQAQQLYESATNLYAAGKIDEAIAAFLQAARHKPNDAPTHYGLGMAYAKSKSYKNAEDSFKQAAKLKPDWPEAHFRVGLMAYVLGNKTKANEIYNKLRRMNSPLANTLRRVISETSATPDAGQAGKDDANPPSELEVSEPSKSASAKESEQSPATQTEPAPAAPVPAQPLSVASKVSSTDSHTTSAPPNSEEVLTSVYRVGVGDTLDIRLLNSSTPRSTLYTVMDGGMIDFPIAGGPITVAGLTTDEIQARIAAELKRRAVEVNALVSVGVRHYSSHAVIVTGLVANPGTRFLRREAIPLYVLMAEVQPRLDAGRITILRAGGEGRTFDLTDTNALGTLIRAGDVLNVGPKQQEFYYIGGRVTYPGQKPFQPGITLLQAILASGGPTENYDNIDLSREGPDGRLTTTRLKLKEIKSGKSQDLKLKPGDRIEVVR